MPYTYRYTSSHMLQGFCQVKSNSKIRKKLGSGWAGQSPTRIRFFWGKNVCFSLLYMFPKKIRQGDGWVGSGQSQFSSDFWNFFNLTRPLNTFLWLHAHIDLYTWMSWPCRGMRTRGAGQTSQGLTVKNACYLWPTFWKGGLLHRKPIKYQHF